MVRTVEQALLVDLTQETLTLPLTQKALAEEVRKAQPDLRDLADVAAKIAREQAALLVVGLTKQKQRKLQMIVSRALDQGWTDSRLDREIADLVGLDPRYAQAVENYRSRLLDQGMSPGKARQAATSYSKRLVRARAHNIAATETQTALMQAQRLLWTQQQEDGDLSRYAVRVWRVHKDERRCVICKPMNGRKASLKAGSGYNVPGIGFVNGPLLHPRCRCFEEVVDLGITKCDPDLVGARINRPLTDNHVHVEARDTVYKHLRGLHDQKTHGHRGAGLQQSGFRRDIEDALVRHRDHGKEPESTFASTLLNLGTEYPQVAVNVRGIDFSPGSLDDSDAKGAMAVIRTTDHGMLILMDPAKIDAAVKNSYERTVVQQSRIFGTPEIRRSESASPTRYAKDYIEGVAVHEFGHIAHFHYEAVMQRGEGSVGRDRDDMQRVQDGMRDESTTGSVKPLTNYAMKNNREKMAEWFAGYYFGILPDGFASDRFIEEFETTLTRSIIVRGGVIKRQDKAQTVCDGHQHDDSVAETVAALGITYRRQPRHEARVAGIRERMAHAAQR